MKELSRIYNKDYDNEVFLKPFISAVKKHKDKYFLAFRTSPNRLTIYYKGREMVALIPESKMQWMVKPRSKSTSKKPCYAKINDEYVEQLTSNGYTLNKQKMDQR